MTDQSPYTEANLPAELRSGGVESEVYGATDTGGQRTIYVRLTPK